MRKLLIVATLFSIYVAVRTPEYLAHWLGTVALVAIIWYVVAAMRATRA